MLVVWGRCESEIRMILTPCAHSRNGSHSTFARGRMVRQVRDIRPN
jgi:hypothetical protein